MRKRIGPMVLAALAAGPMLLTPLTLAQPGAPDPRFTRPTSETRRLLVRARTAEELEILGVDATVAAERARLARQRIAPMTLRTIPGLCVSILDCGSVAQAARVASALAATDDYALVEPDQLLQPAGTPNDPYFGRQWHLARTEANLAWGLTTGARRVTIAMVDTGMEHSHPDARSAARRRAAQDQRQVPLHRLWAGAEDDAGPRRGPSATAALPRRHGGRGTTLRVGLPTACG